jgi:DNA-binding GntR family transcriptional regulator
LTRSEYCIQYAAIRPLLDDTYRKAGVGKKNALLRRSFAGREGLGTQFSISRDYKSIQQLVTRGIRDAIITGVFKPNEKLNQSELAKRFDVSRIPIREALRMLEGEGLVHFHPNHGAIVAAVTEGEIRDIYEIRTALEVTTAQRSIERVSPSTIARMRSALREMKKTSDPELWVRLNDEFHLALYQVGGRPRLLSMIATTRNLVAACIRTSVMSQSNRRAFDLQHASILRAVEERDQAALRKHLKNHLARSCDLIIDSLKRSGVLSNGN